MSDPNLSNNSDYNLGLYSKSSPSQPFQFKRSRTQSIPINNNLLSENIYASSPQKMTNNNMNNNNNNNKSNLSHVPCKFFKQGTCTAGANCTFSHSSDLSSESAVCKYFVKGNCKFGTKCALLHTMSPYGTSAGTIGIKTTNNNSNTPPNVSFIGRRSTAEQLMDPFASSAPAVSLFGQYESSLLWRNSSPRTNMSSTDFIGLHSSPRESMDHHHHLFGSSSSSNNRPYLPTTTTARNNSHSYFSNNFSTSIPEHNQRSFINNDHGYDLNDAMLPSSLNDLFTPTELQARRLREQEHSTGNDWMIDNQQQQWRVPFLTRSSNEFYEDNKSTMTAAINIPGGNNNHEANILSSAYLQQDDIIPQQQDDEVQFFMEDDEVIPNNHKISGHD